MAPTIAQTNTQPRLSVPVPISAPATNIAVLPGMNVPMNATDSSSAASATTASAHSGCPDSMCSNLK